METARLEEIAKKLVADSKGILAADESLPTIEKRFASVGIPSTEETRRSYREILFTTPLVEEFISGVIMFDETIRQKTHDGAPFVEVLNGKGIVPGIKVDQGMEEWQETGEKVTKGLLGLPQRLDEYKAHGAKFTKWRAAILIDPPYPSDKVLEENMERMAEYAKLSQEADMVPIVEPEILMDGSHTTARCEEVTTQALKMLFTKLKQKQVNLKGTLLKPNMVLPGKETSVRPEALEVAGATIRTLTNSVPTEVAGIVFLSGGLSPEESTDYLNEMNKTKVPWPLGFSFGRALQGPVLQAWAGKPENVQLARDEFYKRAKLNSLARKGEYLKEMENG